MPPRELDVTEALPPLSARRVRLLVLARARRGARRLRSDVWPILTGAGAAGIAYGVAHWGVGHAVPVFAAIAAWVCLGFSADRRPRKVAELALGVTLGVAFGEVFAYLFGTGPVQIALVLAIAVALARLLDAGQMFAMQAGVQAVVVVALSTTLGGDGWGRWLDALIGGAAALAVSALLPIDVRRRARALASGGMSEVAETLQAVAKGLRLGDERVINDALVRARGSQSVIDDWHAVVRDAVAATRFTPAPLRHDAELSLLDRASTLCDRAMRNTRVIARGAWAVTPEPGDAQKVADLLARTAQASRDIGFALSCHADLAGLRPQLLSVAAELDPTTFGGWHTQTLVVLLRSLVVDLLEITGLSGRQARETLAETDPGASGGAH